jgi:hypothetical protein
MPVNGSFALGVVIRTFYESTLVQRQVLDGCLCDRTHCGRDLLPVRWSVAEADRGCESRRPALLLSCLRHAEGRSQPGHRLAVHPKGHRALCRDVDIHPVAVDYFVVFFLFLWFQRSTRWVSSRHRCGKSCRS